jgi:hypothetical protein
MDSLSDLLDRRPADEAPEIAIIKSFVERHYGSIPRVIVQQQQIIIGVRGSALAGALRPRLRELEALCSTTKRLVIRIQ